MVRGIGFSRERIAYSYTNAADLDPRSYFQALADGADVAEDIFIVLRPRIQPPSDQE